MGLNLDIETNLYDKGFVKNNDFSNETITTFELPFSKQDKFRVSIYSDSECISVDIDNVSILDKHIIASRFEISTLEEFIFLISRTSRSPLFQIG